MTHFEHAALVNCVRKRSLDTMEELRTRTITVAQMNRRKWAIDFTLERLRHDDSAVGVRMKLAAVLQKRKLSDLRSILVSLGQLHLSRMRPMNAKVDLTKPIFDDEAAAREHLETLVWPMVLCAPAVASWTIGSPS